MCTDAGIGVNFVTSHAAPNPSPVPTTPPIVDRATDSMRNCQMMCRRLAPSALRRPISAVRSLTTISMMFMITMPPTTRDRATTPIRTPKIPAVICRNMPRKVSDVTMPKLFCRLGFRRRWMRSSTVASSIACRSPWDRPAWR